MNHDSSDNCPKNRRSAKNLGSGKPNQDWKKSEPSIGKQVHHFCKVFNLWECFHKRFTLDKHPLRCQDVIDSHQKTGCDQGRQDWHEHICKRLQKLLERVHLFRRLLFQLLFRHLRNIRHFDEFCINIVHNPRSKNNLELSAIIEIAFHEFNIFQGILVNQGLILKDKPEPCRTVCSARNVIFPSHTGQNLLGRFYVLFFHAIFLLHHYLLYC